MKKLQTLATMAVIVLMITVITGGFSAAKDDSIVIDGSTTVGPIAKAFAEYYMGLNPDVNITVSESGSGNGAKSLINGTCHIADMSRGMKDKELAAAKEKGLNPVAHIVANDGIALVVHPSNPVKKLTVEQVRNIYTGKITSWKEVGGPNLKIIVISRDTNSGTYEAFNELVMEKQEIASTTEYVGSNGAIRQRIQSTKSAIGYVGMGFVDRSLKVLTINDVHPTPETVTDGTYPVARPLFMYTNGEPAKGTHLEKFINLYKTEQGRKIIESIGFVPLPDDKKK